MYIVDAHEDLAWNIVTFGRDYTLSSSETRLRERGTQTPLHNGDTLLGWADYQQGTVAVVFSTLFVAPERHRKGEWDTQFYIDYNQAHQMYRAQIDEYYSLVENNPDKFSLVKTKDDLKDLLSHWEASERETITNNGHPVGMVILMEGADGVRDSYELGDWWNLGVRIIGPAWAGTRFCGGTREPGPLTLDGFALLDGMADIGFALDISHMDEQAALQALDHYAGVIIASHSNAMALLKGSNSNRHITDRVIQGIIDRDGVIGVVLLNAFLLAGWKRGDSREVVTLHHLVAHIDHICQMAGDARHVGIGSDFDGGFGLQSVPDGIDTIVDLHKLVPILADMGYSDGDITSIFGENWVRSLQQILPEDL